MAQIVLRATDANGAVSQMIAELRASITDMTPVLNKIADEVVLPALARNYDSSGLKTRRGIVRAAISRRGAKGNVITVDGNSITFTVDYNAVPEAKYALEGRGPVVAKRKKFLRWVDDNGRAIFRRRVGPAPSHTVYYLTDEDLQKATAIVVAHYEGS